jgi:hypothetical protein
MVPSKVKRVASGRGFLRTFRGKCSERSAVAATHTDCFHRLRMGIHAGSNLKLCAIQSKDMANRASMLALGASAKNMTATN